MTEQGDKMMEKSKMRPKLIESVASYYDLYKEYSFIYNELKTLQQSYDNLIMHNYSMQTLLDSERELRISTQHLYRYLLEINSRILPPKELSELDRLDDEDYEERNKSLQSTELKKSLSTLEEQDEEV